MITALWGSYVGFYGKHFFDKNNSLQSCDLPNLITDYIALADALMRHKKNNINLLKAIRDAKNKYSFNRAASLVDFPGWVALSHLEQDVSCRFAPLSICGWAGTSLDDTRNLVKICADEKYLPKEDVVCAQLLAELVFLARTGKNSFYLWTHAVENFPQMMEDASMSTRKDQAILSKALRIFFDSTSYDNAISLATEQENADPNVTFLVVCLAEAYYPLQEEHIKEFLDFWSHDYDLESLTDVVKSFDRTFGPNNFERRNVLESTRNVDWGIADKLVMDSSVELLLKYYSAYWEILQ